MLMEKKILLFLWQDSNKTAEETPGMAKWVSLFKVHFIAGVMLYDKML